MKQFILILLSYFIIHAQFSQFIRIPANEIRQMDGKSITSGHILLNVFHIVSLKEQNDKSIRLNLRNDKKPTTMILENVSFLDFFEKLKLFRSSFVLFENQGLEKSSLILNVFSIASISESQSSGSMLHLTDGQVLAITKTHRETFFKFMGMQIPEISN